MNFFNLGAWSLLQIEMSVKNQNRMANSVEPDETAHYEPPHQALHCLHRYLIRSTGLNGIICMYNMTIDRFICITGS